jgi:hypothetical protein
MDNDAVDDNKSKSKRTRVVPSVNVNNINLTTEESSPRYNKAKGEIDKKIVDNAIKIQDESWIKSFWRPAMAWLYMIICFVDFVLFPAIVMFLPVITNNAIQYTPWVSLTLSNGGLIHMAFGAILGVAAWSRGREKIQKILDR